MAARSGGERPVVVLAGAAPGLGAAVAERFVRAGHRVGGLARSGEFGRRLEEELDGGYRHFLCDVTMPSRVEDVVAEIEREVGRPRVLVYDPMQLVVKPFLELTPREFEQVWRVTCLGAMIVSRALLPGMLAVGGGTLIFTGATAGVKGGPRFASLAAAKFALRGLAQSLAREFGPQGIHVAHVTIDGLLWAPQTEARFAPKREACLEPAAVAESYLHLVEQHPSAWTHELDLRPSVEKF